MKIICIGRNYSDHAKELGNEAPAEPIIFMKPASSMLIDNKPFFIPDFTSDVHYELELVIKISKNGKAIEEQFASRYYDQIGLGIDFTARDVQQELKAKGLPWEKAKGFDGSAVVSQFQPLTESNYEFSLLRNGKQVQHGHSRDMIFSFDRLVADVSRYFKLTLGDLIFTGTPAGVGKVEVGDRLQARLGEQELIDMRVK